MTNAPSPDTDHLLDQARRGDDGARQQLLARHRGRLRRMVALHLDPRLTAREDASDVVQEALLEADRRLDDYLKSRPLPFYPWLRQIAWDRLIELRRRHRARKRSVAREEVEVLDLPESSLEELAARLSAPGSSPSERLLRSEQSQRVRAALERLPPRDREVLVLRHLEQMKTDEVAAVLKISVGAVKVRHLRALQRLRGLLGEELP
jgi:RNA polymerase sigma-70 factor (ECF subfamily)